MTVICYFGRRVPKSWFRRQANKAKGLISFQENLWIMIKQSVNLAKKKANASGKLTYVVSFEKESEDLHYELEWIKVIIKGSKEIEEDEHKDCLKMYDKFSNVLKKDIPEDERMKSHFKSKILSTKKVKEAYNKGYGAVSDNNLANKLLEMGILTHFELLDDYDIRN